MKRPDWESWGAEAPPPGFAEKVVSEVTRGATAPGLTLPSRARRVAAGVVVAVALAAVFVLALRTRRAAAHGEANADQRREVRLGSRALAVLEAGAKLRWDGDEVTQAAGDVFFRVEPGARFVVHTAAGDVAVKGTCFSVKVRDQMTRRDAAAAAVGAAASAMVLVGVYEGRVTASQGASTVDLAAGEGAAMGPGGVRRTSTTGAGPDGTKAASAENDDSLLAANQNLADSVQAYKQRLEAIGSEKALLQQKLKEAEAKLAAGDAAVSAPKSEYDLSQGDWKGLAKEGEVRSRMPCSHDGVFTYSPKSLQKLGLSPQDGVIMGNARTASYKRTWGVVKPLCEEALGVGADVAERVGETACENVILDMARAKDNEAADEATRQVAEIRAGERPTPGPNEPVSPVVRVLLATTGEAANLVNDLTQSFGPDEARRLVFADEGCWHNHSSNVGPRSSPSP